MTLETYTAMVTAMWLGCTGVWLLTRLLDGIAERGE